MARGSIQGTVDHCRPLDSLRTTQMLMSSEPPGNEAAWNL